ncbi:MAG: hypothetical protein ACFFBI_10480 [Promethearchaeota archaeon]
MDIELTHDLYFAAMERLYLEFKENNPGVSITELSRNSFSPDYVKIENELGTGRHLWTALNPDYGPSFFSKETLQDLLQTLAKWHFDHFDKQNKLELFEFGNRKKGLYYDRNDPDNQRMLHYYQKAINSIIEYDREKKLGLNSPSLSTIKLVDNIKTKKELIMNHYQISAWDKDTTKAYHNVYHLCKYLGFDPMTFTPLDDDIFKTGRYRRHHFLALAFRKMSSHVDDIVLTSVDLHHSEYETFLTNGGLAAEDYVKLLMQSLSELIEMKDQNGNFLKIDESHMRDVLLKNFGEAEGQKLLDKWKSFPNFIQRLSEFNNRRLRTFNGDYKQFLSMKYHNAYSAYFKKVSRITYTKIFATQDNLDFLAIIYNKPFKLKPIQVKIQ